MIELSLGMVNDISYVLQAEDKRSMNREFEDKYNITISELEEIVDDYIDETYINNKIYHIVPMITISSIFLNILIMMVI